MRDQLSRTKRVHIITPEEAAVADLKATNIRLMRQLAKANAKREDLVNAVYQAAKDAASALDLPNVVKPRYDKRRARTPETAIAVLSDWQLAKRTATYNTKVCESRIELYARKVIRLTKMQRAAHPVRNLRVYLLGDLIEGEMIFPGQAHLIDGSMFAQVMLDGPRILGNFLRHMLTEFDTVEVTGVIGNHGALGSGPFRRAYHPESNADAMMYEATRLVLQSEKRLKWAPNFTPGERKWYAVDYIGDKGFLLFHGDQVRGFTGVPWNAFKTKLLGWATGAIPERFDYAVAGHYHTPTRMLAGRIRCWVSGSTESDNTYASEQLAAMGTPSQWLLFCRGDRGVTAEYEIHLGDDYAKGAEKE